jgi:hypothetical protein
MKFQKGNKYGRFTPGVSGNPGGKPKKIREVAAAARERTMEAIETLTEIMRDAKATASARVSAADILLERGWGKAPQTIELRRDDDFRNLTDDELTAIAAGDALPEPNGGSDPSAAPDDQGQPH